MDGSEIATNLLANPEVRLDPVGLGAVRSERAVLNSKAFRAFGVHGSEAADVQNGSEADGPSERTALKPSVFQNGWFGSQGSFRTDGCEATGLELLPKCSLTPSAPLFVQNWRL